jgi:hypothetical protein
MVFSRTVGGRDVEFVPAKSLGVEKRVVSPPWGGAATNVELD